MWRFVFASSLRIFLRILLIMILRMGSEMILSELLSVEFTVQLRQLKQIVHIIGHWKSGTYNAFFVVSIWSFLCFTLVIGRTIFRVWTEVQGIWSHEGIYCTMLQSYKIESMPWAILSTKHKPWHGTNKLFMIYKSCFNHGFLLIWIKESLQTTASGKEIELKTQLSDLMASLKSVKERLNLSEVRKLFLHGIASFIRRKQNTYHTIIVCIFSQKRRKK